MTLVMAEWFYVKENAQHGPTSELELRNLISSGAIQPETVIWREGMSDWVPIKETPELNMAANTTDLYQSPQAGMAAPLSAQPQTDTLAIVSLVLGILGLLASCFYIGAILGIPAVICGHLSLKNINNSPVAISGKGSAIAGLITGYLATVTTLCLVAVITFALSKVGTHATTP